METLAPIVKQPAAIGTRSRSTFCPASTRAAARGIDANAADPDGEQINI
jgi:hypothetical protein